MIILFLLWSVNTQSIWISFNRFQVIKSLFMLFSVHPPNANKPDNKFDWGYSLHLLEFINIYFTQIPNSQASIHSYAGISMFIVHISFNMIQKSALQSKYFKCDLITFFISSINIEYVYGEFAYLENSRSTFRVQLLLLFLRLFVSRTHSKCTLYRIYHRNRM